MLHPDTLSAWTDQKGREHAGKVCGSKGEFKVIECTCCEFKHVIPLPTAEELETVYAHEYYTQEKPLYIDRYMEDKAWWEAVYAERFEVLETLINRRQGAILDVGSGPGLFLNLGRSRGWKVTGIEPSLRAAEYSRDAFGLDVHNTFLDRNTAARMGKFDAVNIGEVLEHLTSPVEMLDIAKGLITPGGVLSVVVPNDFNPLQTVLHERLGYEPWWVAPPHHLNYFSHESLKGLVERAGFEVIRVESTFPIDIFLLMGQNYIENDTLGRQVHSLRKTFDQNLINKGAMTLRRKLYGSFAELGLGREVVLYARKPV